MSFSSDIKAEAGKLKPADCCQYAELYGILLLSRTFCNADIFYSSPIEEVAERCRSLIKGIYGFRPELLKDRGNWALKAGILEVAKVYTDFITTEYITDAFGCQNCLSAFARGAFLSAGTATDPQKDFHLEIKTPSEPVAISMQSIFSSAGMNAHLSHRQKNYLVYFKGSSSVSDFLAFIGASKTALTVIDCSVEREMRGMVNRRRNCETANIGKTVDAVIRQTHAIETLKKSGRLYLLSDELQTAARLRTENPELSLGELSKICNISRSGLNHRFQRLITLAAEETQIAKETLK